MQTADADTELFFVDEADIDVNPRIGFIWSRRCQQIAVPAPGQSEKHYVSGALHPHIERLVWMENERRNPKLLLALRRRYRRARRVVLALVNYVIHESETIADWLAANPKFKL